MLKISLDVNLSNAKATATGKITSGMVGTQVKISYDDSWSGLIKTAYFRVGDMVRKCERIGSTTVVPWEVLRKHGKVLYVGVEGKTTGGEIVIPTVWAKVGTVYEGASGEIPAAPAPNEETAPSIGAVIDDSATTEFTTWSSQKISDEISSKPGGSGVDGTTFYPYVSEEGVISWSNDGDKENPQPVNIKGDKGDKGDFPVAGVDYYTEADKTEMVAAVIAALPVYDGEVVAV